MQAGAALCETAHSVQADAGNLAIGAVLVALAAVGVRVFVTRDIHYLYNYVLDVKSLIDGIPWGAIYALGLAALAALVLLASLFAASAVFDGGAGSLALPPGIARLRLLTDACVR